MGCLGLNREEFSKRFEQRGWSYDTKTHEWSKGGKTGIPRGELVLFGPQGGFSFPGQQLPIAPPPTLPCCSDKANLNHPSP